MQNKLGFSLNSLKRHVQGRVYEESIFIILWVKAYQKGVVSRDIIIGQEVFSCKTEMLDEVLENDILKVLMK